MVPVGSQPFRKIAFNRLRPSRIDLARRVFPFAKPLMAEHIAETGHFRILDNPLGQLGRDEDHSSIFAEHNIAGHDHYVTDARGTVDTNHR